MNHLLEKLTKLAEAYQGTSVGHTVREAQVMLADFKDEGAEEAVRAMKAMQFKFVDGAWTPPAKIDHRNTIYTQAYDVEGKRVVSGIRSSSEPARDCHVMDAAIELYYAGAVRKQDNITPHVLWRHVMGEEWPDARKEVAAITTLQGLGYTHEGGVQWKPPLGKPWYAQNSGQVAVMHTELKTVGWVDPLRVGTVYGYQVTPSLVPVVTRPEAEAQIARLLDGWKEAAIAWTVCASVHEHWAKGKDALYKTRHTDFERHAADARAKAITIINTGEQDG